MKNDLLLANSLPEIFILLHPQIKTYRYFIRLHIFFLAKIICICMICGKATYITLSFSKKKVHRSFNSIQSLSRVWHCDPMDCSTPGFPVHHQVPELSQIHVYPVSDTIQPSHLVLSPSPAINLFQHQDLFSESVLPIRWTKYWSFSFSISPTNEYSGLISFRVDWFDPLLVVVCAST